MKPNFLVLFLLVTLSTISAQPPYFGTIFINGDIITSDFPSAIQSTTYTGQGMVTMYDRRTENWETVNAFLFDVVWDDGLTSRAQVNPEFGSVATATVEAEKYARIIGQLPTCLRVDVDEIWIQAGVELFGGGNQSILIHTGQTVIYENSGILEETLVHEAAHTSLDAAHAESAGWLQAQMLDPEFISTYAQDNPIREDIAESFLPWMMVRYRADVLEEGHYNTITETIPNRLAYFDAIACDLYPFDEILSADEADLQEVRLYPNPAVDIIQLEGILTETKDVKIYNLLGQDFTHLTTFDYGSLDVSALPSGYYILKGDNFSSKLYKI